MTFCQKTSNDTNRHFFIHPVYIYPYYNEWMSLCIMERYISETWPPILMKLGMKFTHILIVNRGKFHLISPINKNFSLINVYKRSRLRERQKRYISETWPPILMKLSTIHYQYMGELHAKLHQNWSSGFRDIAWHGTLNNKWMSLCIMERYISETWPPILMKLGMKFTHILIVNRGKFHLILPINKNFSLITTFCTNVFIQSFFRTEKNPWNH